MLPQFFYGDVNKIALKEADSTWHPMVESLLDHWLPRNVSRDSTNNLRELACSFSSWPSRLFQGLRQLAMARGRCFPTNTILLSCEPLL